MTETSAAGEIRAISLHGRMYQVSCYLVRAGTGFVLIDTGLATRRAELRRALEAAGCRPGDLRLIVLTHGDPPARAWFEQKLTALMTGTRVIDPVPLQTYQV